MQIDGVQRYYYYKSCHGSAKKKNSHLIDIREVCGGFLGQNMWTFGSGLPADE